MSSFPNMLRASVGRSLPRTMSSVNRLAAPVSQCTWNHVATSGWRMQASTTNATSNSSLLVHSFHSTPQVWQEESGDNQGAESKDALMDLLNREHDEEVMNDSTELPSELQELKDDLSKEWKIVEDAGITRLVRTTANTNLKVQVTFHCQDVVEEDMMEEGFEDEEEKTEEDDDEEEPAPVRFSVIASKAGQTMVFSCLSENAAAPIQSVAISNSDDLHSLMTTGGVPAAEYQGPEFSELAQDLQFAFQDFLEKELGVNEDVACFVAMYADYKEQAQYVEFLERAKRILS